MKKLNRYLCVLLLVLLSVNGRSLAQETKPRLLVDIAYYAVNNQYPYVTVYTKTKVEKKFFPAANVTVKIYLGEETDASHLGTVTTDKFGQAGLVFPPAVKLLWDTVSQFKIIAATVADKKYPSASNEVSYTKARIAIDTAAGTDGGRAIVARITARQGNEWVPAKEVETKIIIKRSVGDLSVGDKETYSTDSSGTATADFTKTGMPGDAEGNIVVVAKTEDNDQYGNISIEKKVKWGAPFVPLNTFDKRTLFATRDKAPLWLLLLAGSIVVSVWSVIIYLIRQILRIRKLGLTNK